MREKDETVKTKKPSAIDPRRLNIALPAAVNA